MADRHVTTQSLRSRSVRSFKSVTGRTRGRAEDVGPMIFQISRTILHFVYICYLPVMSYLYIYSNQLNK
jgi:hypothetical protein